MNKKCGCGREYNLAQWRKLDFVGWFEDEDIELLEYRNCKCGSTLAVEVMVGTKKDPFYYE